MIQLEVLSPSSRPTGPSTELLSIGASVPIGSKSKVYVDGWNDMATKQKMGISWVVKDPDGYVVEDYHPDIDWSFEYVNPDEDHRFYGDRFDLDKVGTYTIAIELFMNQASPVIVDSYDGPLCTTTTEVPPEYELIQHTVSPYAYIYDGNAETCIFEFGLPLGQLLPIREKIVDAFVSKLEEEGSRLLELKVYEAPWYPPFLAYYRVEVTATASSIPWTAIIIAVLAIVFIFAITYLILTIDKVVFKRKPISEKIKKTWPKPTLISVINAFEIELELTPRPPAELEGMSEQELRDYCDMLAEEIAPPGVSWLPWAIAGGVGVLAVGTVAVLAVKKKEIGRRYNKL